MFELQVSVNGLVHWVAVVVSLHVRLHRQERPYKDAALSPTHAIRRKPRVHGKSKDFGGLRRDGVRRGPFPARGTRLGGVLQALRRDRAREREGEQGGDGGAAGGAELGDGGAGEFGFVVFYRP